MLFDGAMGSLLYDRGVFHTKSYDELNISQPSLVYDIHCEYVAAGADIIETNTFGANRIALRRHNQSENAKRINIAAVKTALKAADGRAYVAGAIGPTGISYSVASLAERKDATKALFEQAQTLMEAGVDLLLFETFTSIQELESIVFDVREFSQTIPIVAQIIFDAEGKVEGLLTPEEVVARLKQSGANAVGANCGGGPHELYDIAVKMVGHGLPVAVQPNGGHPSNVDGRTIYVANPEHFGVFARRLLKAGVQMVGGCCGTTPAHTRQMLGAVRMMGGEKVKASPAQGSPTNKDDPNLAPSLPKRLPSSPLSERSRLGKKLSENHFALSVELTAPPGTDPKGVMKKLEELIDGGVDTINIAEGPRASVRMSNLAFCAIAERNPSVETILHVCGRDRSYLGQVSHLLGAHALGIRNLVLITGDPPKMGDYPFSTPVYDVDSIGLLEIAYGLNCGFDPAGKPIPGGATSFVLAVGAEPAARDYDRELRRLERKKQAGADLIMTQPVYDPETLARFLRDVEKIGLPVMVGLLPLASHRNAEFLHNEVPGMQIPAQIRERMAKAATPAKAREEGVTIAKHALASVLERVAGAYIMPPFNRVDSALAIANSVAKVSNKTVT